MSARPRLRLLIPLGAVLAAVLAAGAAFMGSTRPAVEAAEGMKAGRFDPAHTAPDFSLPGSDGSEVSPARYRGKVVLLTFGFTYCAAVCPATLATLAQARARLGRKAESVQVIFVTVDPARDDAVQLRKYLAAFDPGFVGATGTAPELAAVRERYGVTAAREGAGPDYVIAHTSSIFLIDRAGRLRGMMPFGREPADFVHDIELLLSH